MNVVQLVQANYCYGPNAFLPYSAGLLQAYAQAQPDLAARYQFSPIVFQRTPVNDLVASMDAPDVLGLSCYIWNWAYSKAVGAAVKQRWPHCKVVLGGPHVPHRFAGFAAAHPWADIIVHHEGELTFATLLRQLLAPDPQLEKIPGLIICAEGRETATPPAPRITDLDALPSPYLTGVFDTLVLAHPQLQFQATQETHRGCPYECKFCDWGSSVMTKVRQFSSGRVVAEYEWFGTHGIDLLYNADANYALFERDYDLTAALIQTKQKHGRPTKFRAAYAKNSTERVHRVSKLLNDHGMCKGVTLSFQSMDPATLEAVRRTNMRINNFRELITLYRKDNIPTYSELILGLPGETYASMVTGIDKLFEAGQHDSLNVYHAMLLPNSEMSAPEYRTAHKIQGVTTQLLLLHGTQDSTVHESYELSVATASMPIEDWVRASLFAYVAQALHCLNLTQQLAIISRYALGIPYADFYTSLIQAALCSDTFVGVEFRRVEAMLKDIAAGQGNFDTLDSRFGSIMWPVEEILFLRLLVERENWFRPVLAPFLEHYYGQAGMVEDLLIYQTASTKAPDGTYEALIKYNWSEIVAHELEPGANPISVRPAAAHAAWQPDIRDWVTFAREAVWYGRKGSSMRRSLSLRPLFRA